MKNQNADGLASINKNNASKTENNVESLLLEIKDHFISESKMSNYKKIDILKLEIEIRKTRNLIFSNDLFGEASWDILLDLYVNYLDGKKTPIKSVTIASNAPATTVLRHINMLERKEFIQKFKDVQDNRLTILQLTEKSIMLFQDLIARFEVKYRTCQKV